MKTLSAPLFRIVLTLVLGTCTVEAGEILWKFETDGMVVAKAAVTDDMILVTGGQVVVALDQAGRELWKTEIEGEVAADLNISDDAIYVHSSAGLHALALDGEQLWLFENADLGPLVDGRTWGWGNEILPDPWGWYRCAPLVRDEVVYFGSSDGVHAVSRKSGEQLWQVPIGPVTAGLVAFEDTLIAASWNNSVYSLDAENGALKWRFKGRVPASQGVDWIGYAGFNLTPALHEERIYVGSRGTSFYSIDASSGTEVWSTKVGSSWIGSPAVIHGDTVYFGLSDGMAVLGHATSGGSQKLFFETGSLVFAQPRIRGDQLIVGSLSGHLFSIDTTTGTGDPVIHFGTDEKRYAEFFQPEIIPPDLTPHQGVAWAVDQMLTRSNSILSLEVIGDTAYVGTGSGVVYAVDLGDE